MIISIDCVSGKHPPCAFVVCSFIAPLPRDWSPDYTNWQYSFMRTLMHDEKVATKQFFDQEQWDWIPRTVYVAKWKKGGT